MKPWVNDRVRDAAATASSTLDLSHAYLAKLPCELLSLTAITHLSLAENRINGDEIRLLADLPRLQSVNLVKNGISKDDAQSLAVLTQIRDLNVASNFLRNEGAISVSVLKNLVSLNVEANIIDVTGAIAISKLRNLRVLNIGMNEIGDAGVGAIASNLRELTELDVSANDIGDEGALALAKITGLRSLDASGNRIGIRGISALLDAWERLSDLKGRMIDLRSNGDLSQMLPAEVLNSTDAPTIIAAYRSFRRAARQGTTQQLNEAKLLILGNEAVGKTSLVRYLIHNKPRNPDERKTRGAAIHEKIETQLWQIQESPIKLHVWDFGGQEIFRSTHRYFLTARTLYLVVLEARREDDDSLDGWLQCVRNLGGDSPVIVVTNKSDLQDHVIEVDDRRLQERYPGIAFIRTSCNNDKDSAMSIAALRKRIVETLSNDPRLRYVRDPIPPSWLRVKNAVAKVARQRRVMSIRDFQRLCEGADQKVKRHELVSEESEQTALLRLLHYLGVVIAYGFDEISSTASLREVTLLDPNWLTGAIYTLLDHPDVRDEQGVFTRESLNDLLDTKIYLPQWHEFILQMMQHEEIGLVVEIPGMNGHYLVPTALPKYPPYLKNWSDDCLRFRYRYSLLPSGLIPRFVVYAHSLLADPPVRWRSGVVLEHRDCSVLVRSDQKQTVDILIDGPPNERRPTLDVVRHYFDQLHRRFRVAPGMRVPLKAEPEIDVSYDDLVRMERDRGPHFEFLPDGANRYYAVRELLDGVRPQAEAEIVKSQPELPYDVIVSWSKEQSRIVATKLHDLLPEFLPGFRPWISTKDIAKGAEWFDELQSVLSGSRLCILCVTEENCTSEWLHYEAGAIASHLGAHVYPYLIGINGTSISGKPLSQFQLTASTKQETFALIASLNLAKGRKFSRDELREKFEGPWRKLQRVLASSYP